MIERRGVTVHSVRVIMVPIAAAAVAAAVSAAIAEVVVVCEAVVEVLEVVVAGANGRVGRFRSKGDFPDALAAGSNMGRCQAPSLTLQDLRPRF